MKDWILNNKVAIITGASKGIGEAMARGLAEFGANVVISSRKQEAVDKVAAEFNYNAVSVIADVSKETAIEDMIKTAIDEFGQLDILFNNVSISPSTLSCLAICDFIQSLSNLPLDNNNFIKGYES